MINLILTVSLFNVQPAAPAAQSRLAARPVRADAVVAQVTTCVAPRTCGKKAAAAPLLAQVTTCVAPRTCSKSA